MVTAALALPAAVMALPDCGRRLALSLDGQDGAFDGMSHSGVLVILRNTGLSACKVAGLPTLSFLTRSGKVLPIARKAPPGMHPGPIVLPVALAPGAIASTALRWVSGNVFDNGRCLTAAKVAVRIGRAKLTAPWGRAICGALGEPAPFEQPLLQTQAAAHD